MCRLSLNNCCDAVQDRQVPGVLCRLLSFSSVGVLDIPSGPQMTLTFCFDPQGCPDEGKQGGVEHNCPVAVQRHVHGDQALEGMGSNVGDHGTWF